MNRELRHPYPFHRWREATEDVGRMEVADRVLNRRKQMRAVRWKRLALYALVLSGLAVAALGDVAFLIVRFAH